MWIPNANEVVKCGKVLFVVAQRSKRKKRVLLWDGTEEGRQSYSLEDCSPLHPAQKCVEPVSYWSLNGEKYPIERFYGEDGGLKIRTSFMAEGTAIKIPDVERSFKDAAHSFAVFFEGMLIDESREMPVLDQWKHLRESA